MNRILRYTLASAAAGTLVVTTACNNEKYHQEVLAHMGKQLDEQQKLAATAEDAKDLATEASKVATEDRQRIAVLEKKLEEQKNRLEALATESEELRKMASAPKNVSAENAAENGIALTVLTNPRIRALVCPVLAELGGPRAEARLIDLVSTDKDATVTAAAVKGLVDMKSSQTVKVLNAAIATAVDSNARTIASYMATHCDATSREPALAAIKRLANSNDYDDRQARQSLYFVLAKVGTANDFAAIEQLFNMETDSSAKASAMGTLVALGQGHKDKIVNLVMANGALLRSNDGMVEKLLPYADYKLTDTLVNFIPNMGWTARRHAYGLLAAAKDPVAAEFLVARYNGKESDGDCKRTLKEIFQAKYPGIHWDIQKENASLAPADELKTLIDARNLKLKGGAAPGQKQN